MSKTVKISDHSCTLGRIEKRSTPTANGNAFAYGAIVIPENETTKAPAIWQNIKAFGSTAETLAKHKRGTQMIVWGEEHENTYMHEGLRKTERVLTITKFTAIPTNKFAKA